jgi:hypothetical protein
MRIPPGAVPVAVLLLTLMLIACGDGTGGSGY